MNDTWWVKPNQLDDSQKAVIDLPLNASHLIEGPPGSGKTNLLLLRGSQMVAEGKPNILILTFTRTLREFIATGGTHYTFGVDKVKTLSRWQYDFLKEQGIQAAEDDDFTTQREARLDQIQQIVADSNLPPQYEAIILDEAQDYLLEELDLFFKLGKVVFAAADSRQQIYNNDDAKPGEFLTRFHNRYPLKYHYRNCLKICSVADKISEGKGAFEALATTCNYDEAQYPSLVTTHPSSPLRDQITAAAMSLERQMKAYPGEYLGLLCPSRKCLKEVWTLVQRLSIADRAVCQSAEDGYVEFEPSKPICVCTVHGSKGLEFRAMHLLDTEGIKRIALNRNLSFTAVTRAKTSLTIYHDKAIPGYLEGALASIRKPTKPVKIEDLFGGNKNAV